MNDHHFFNVRVYGLLINDKNQVLISDEQEFGKRFSKFPGGGLEYGEGLPAALKREFIEECSMEIEILRHFYTTDFFVKSVFNESQLISVYYLVTNVSDITLKITNKPFDFESDNEIMQSFRWVNIEDLNEHDVTFPVDKHVVKMLKSGNELS
jgi:8-oxo-dGTP diphosphatase